MGSHQNAVSHVLMLGVKGLGEVSVEYFCLPHPSSKTARDVLRGVQHSSRNSDSLGYITPDGCWDLDHSEKHHTNNDS